MAQGYAMNNYFYSESCNYAYATSMSICSISLLCGISRLAMSAFSHILALSVRLGGLHIIPNKLNYKRTCA